MTSSVVSQIVMDDETSKPESSSSSICLSPPKIRMRYNDDLVVGNNNAKKYKGVVPQANRHYGAQIYVNKERIWLGTFKSAYEAAMAYDSALLLLRGSDPITHPRNLPLTDVTVREADFQKHYNKNDVLNMIREGSYQQKLRDFLRNECDSNRSRKSREGEESDNCPLYIELFRKELTSSDVGKLNRLVIPKKYALRYLPYIRYEDIEEGEIIEVGEYAEVVIFDRDMREWKFRYCYWRSSQSFVFTKGWISFVKEKKLKMKDVLVFFACEYSNNVKGLDGQSKNFLMIHVLYLSYDNDNSLLLEEVKENVYNTSDENLIAENSINSNLEDKETTLETTKNKEGFMLFGVRIQ